MLINTYYNGIEIHRKDKIIYARFLRPHDVISTCRAAGGIQHDLNHMINHQSCEPAGHMHRHPADVWRDPDRYRRLVCESRNLPSENSALLGTAANMNNASFKRESFRDLEVIAVCTGGVEGNAGRVGDPASVYETGDGFEKINRVKKAHDGPGTINTMLFINTPLTPGALVRTIVTATEAKSAVLQELAVHSLYSDGLATGTGTDQIGVAALRADRAPLTSAGKHSSLGELIGLAVMEAIRETLALQNHLTPSGQCSTVTHLKRFGLTRGDFLSAVCRQLPRELAGLLDRNFQAVEQDPVTVGAVASLVHLKDKLSWGILPTFCWKEVMGTAAAQVACAVSGDYTRISAYRETLGSALTERTDTAFKELACRALALGFRDKWE